MLLIVENKPILLDLATTMVSIYQSSHNPNYHPLVVYLLILLIDKYISTTLTQIVPLLMAKYHIRDKYCSKMNIISYCSITESNRADKILLLMTEVLSLTLEGDSKNSDHDLYSINRSILSISTDYTIVFTKV